MKKHLFEIEVLSGLKGCAIKELKRLVPGTHSLITTERDDQICIEYSGQRAELLKMRCAVAVYAVKHFLISRPKALLGDENFKNLIKQMNAVSVSFKEECSSFRISAAGKDSSVFKRIIAAIESETGLVYDADDGELLMRFRPAMLYQEGWEVLLRLSPKPLSARAWRVADMKGALNATLASAMVEMSEPKDDDCFLNLMCGSGTLLIERLKRQPARQVLGIDNSKTALACAAKNIKASGLEEKISLMCADVTGSSLADKSFDVICADLPWGERIGARETNQALYNSTLGEMCRIGKAHARFVLLSQDTEALDRALSAFENIELKHKQKVYQGGYHPSIYLLNLK